MRWLSATHAYYVIGRLLDDLNAAEPVAFHGFGQVASRRKNQNPNFGNVQNWGFAFFFGGYIAISLNCYIAIDMAHYTH